MKQKLALTCALVTRPDLLILDEPTYGVDPESRKEFWKILYRLNKEGKTILVSTPYMDEAELCTRIAFIDKGRIVAVDSPARLKEKFPYHLLELRGEFTHPSIIKDISGILDTYFYGDKFHLVIDSFRASRENVIQGLKERGIPGEAVKEIPPSMEDVFVSLVQKEVV